jgi:hypothetical protein
MEKGRNPGVEGGIQDSYRTCIGEKNNNGSKMKI